MTETKKHQKTILACLSASPSSQRVIRAAAKLYDPEHDQLIALYVSNAQIDTHRDPVLRENIELAKNCGAEIHTIESNDIALTIAEYARHISATDLFIGYSAPSHLRQTQSIHETLLSYLPDADIHIIPDARSSSYPQTIRKIERPVFNVIDVLILAGIMTLATVLSYWFDQSRFSNSNIVTIYILAVLVTSILTSHRIYGIIAAILYILLFNFLFIDPRFTFFVYDSAYLVTYFVTLAAALITGSLAVRLKNIARLSAQNAYQGKILLDTSNQLEKVSDRREMIEITCSQISSLLKRKVWFYQIAENGEIQNPEGEPATVDPLEAEAVRWTHENGHHSGRFTSRYSSCANTYLSVHASDFRYGVIAIEGMKDPLSEFENAVMLSMINEFTLALNNERSRWQKAQAELNAEKEHFRAGLLRSVSHDFRTPLTAIYGNADTLVLHHDELDENDRRSLCEDIRNDAHWLEEQMENILFLTRLENREYLHPTVENMNEIIEESLHRMSRNMESHTVVWQREEDPLLVEADAGMIVRVLVNLLSNAVKYTPPQSRITLSAFRTGENICVEVADDGPGIPAADQEHIFEMYYTGKKGLADSSRSIGIGLNLCRMIMQAHGGEISVRDNVPQGTVFRISLKGMEVDSV